MKRILALVMLAVLISANAFAQAVDQAGNKITATLGDQDSNKNYRVNTDTTGLVQYANDTSIAYPYEIINTTNTTTGTYTFSSTDSGLYIEDFGGFSTTTSAPGTKTGRGAIYTLPACVTSTLGFNFTVGTAVKETITVTPSTTADSLDYSIAGTGLNAGQGVKTSSGQAGDKIGVACVSPGQWQVIDDGVTVASAP